MALESKLYDLCYYFEDVGAEKKYFLKLFDTPVSKMNVNQKIKIGCAWHNALARFVVCKLKIPIGIKAYLISVLKTGGLRFKTNRKRLYAIVYHARNENPEYEEFFVRFAGK